MPRPSDDEFDEGTRIQVTEVVIPVPKVEDLPPVGSGDKPWDKS